MKGGSMNNKNLVYKKLYCKDCEEWHLHLVNTKTKWSLCNFCARKSA